MPDFWETAMGLNVNDSSDQHADKDGDGYTNLEEYINDLALARLCLDYYNPPYPIPSDWPDYNPGCCKSVALEEANNPAGKVPKLCVSPNPWQGGVLTVRPPSGNGRISIVDVKGREAARAPAGKALTFGRTAFVPGLYLVRYASDDGRMFARKLVVIK
jgi:hypothetical protein